MLPRRLWWYSFLILLGLAVAWLVAFPIKAPSDWDLEDIVMETSIWGAVFFSFLIFPKKWTLLLFWGWFAFLFANTIDLLDEFTSEPGFFDTVLEGLLWAAGWLIIIVSFYRENFVLEREKERDPLTGLLNRYFLEQKFPGIFRELIRKKSPVTFIFADLDALKEINDRFSHQAGDLVLERLGRIFEESVRKGDYVLRIGGDEFLLILPETDEKEGKEVVKRIREKLKCWSETFPFPVDCSFGVYTLNPPYKTTSLEEALYEADQRMYQEKKNKKKGSLL
ncbi:MAG: GGDEF domain-containing protein [Candidatus Atribacteria bacterium]|nr:GGDEF domain-containing protein [Candidatus Atribacteria bacterium]MCD6350076.1 GGDEF domain-containing protein [Candidatus Atribacteria bacterium]